MKIFFLNLCIFILYSCDTISIRPTKDECISHWWNKNKIFRIENYDDKHIYLKENKGTDIKKINYFSKGWSKIKCD